MVGAGDLDRLIQLQSATVTYDAGNNEPIETWSTYATVWAQIRYLTEGERLSAEKWFSEQVASFVVRYRSGIEPTHRIIYDGKTFEIRGPPREIGRRAYLDIGVRLVQ